MDPQALVTQVRDYLKSSEAQRDNDLPLFGYTESLVNTLEDVLKQIPRTDLERT